MKFSILSFLFLFVVVIGTAQIFSPVFNTKSPAKLKTTRSALQNMVKVAEPSLEFKKGKEVSGFPYLFCNGNGDQTIQIIGLDNDVKYFSWFAVFKKPFDPNEKNNKVMMETAKAAGGSKGAVWVTKNFYHLQKVTTDMAVDTVIDKSIGLKIDFRPSVHLISVEVKII